MLNIREIGRLARERETRTGECYRDARTGVLRDLLSEELPDCERRSVPGRHSARLGWLLGRFCDHGQAAVEAYVDEEHFTLAIQDGDPTQALLQSHDAATMSLLLHARCTTIGKRDNHEPEPRQPNVRYIYPPSRAEEKALAAIARTEDYVRGRVRVGPPRGFKVRPFGYAFQDSAGGRVIGAMYGQFTGRKFVVGGAGCKVLLTPVDTGLDRAGPFVWLEETRVRLDPRGLRFAIERDANRLYMGAVRVAFGWGDDKGTDRRVDASTIVELFFTKEGFPGGSGHRPDRLVALTQSGPERLTPPVLT